MKCAVTTLATACCLPIAAFAWSIESNGARAVFSDATGAIISLQGDDAVERIVPTAEMFTLSLLDDAGNETVLKSSDFALSRKGGDLAYSRKEGPFVEIAVRADSGTFTFKSRVSNWPKGFRLNWIDAPHVNVSTTGRLYWPYLDGCEVSDYTTRTNRNSWCYYEPITWVKRCQSFGGLYPGNAQMQFLAHYQDGKGVYFSAEDDHHTQKGVEWEYLPPKAARLSLQTFCGEADGRVYDSRFVYRLQPYDGDWMEGCALYRNWIRTLPAFKTPTDYPEWAKDSPVTLIYPVKGEGMDNTMRMKPNRYYPYENVLPDVMRYKQAFESKVMALLMHWEGTAPWAPPYVWPPFGGEAELAKLRDALHAHGDLLGLYCSGTAWTQVSCIEPRYTQTAKFTDENLGRFMMRGAKGEIDASVCNHPFSQRFGYDLCLTEAWSRKTLLDEVQKLARFGVDYCQFFDQNLGGGANLCWSARHRHPSVPGAWQTDAMLTLQNEMIANARAIGSKMTIGCEGAAATPFVKNLFFNDSRSFFARRHGRAVPGLSFVFHEWMCNFSGNQVAVKTDEHFRWSYAFHCGDMLSVVLGPNGKLVTAWAVPWSEPIPDQEKLIGLVHSLNALRRRYPEFLLNGRMIRPPFEIRTKAAKIIGDSYEHEYGEVLWSYWQDAAGRTKGFATNWQKHPSVIQFIKKGDRAITRTIAPLQTIEF